MTSSWCLWHVEMELMSEGFIGDKKCSLLRLWNFNATKTKRALSTSSSETTRWSQRQVIEVNYVKCFSNKGCKIMT